MKPTRRNPTMTRAAVSHFVLAGLALISLSTSAADGGQLAVDYGCVNCHSSTARSAPSLKQLAEELGRKGDQPEALQGVLRELRGQTSIRSHQMVPDAPALAILQWLAQGAK